MANHKSALKRARQNELRRLRNKVSKTRMKTIIKEVRTVADAQSKEAAMEKLTAATSIIDKAAKKGVIHPNTAARKVSRLSRLVNTIGG